MRLISGGEGDTGENNEQRVKTSQSVKTKTWFQRKTWKQPQRNKVNTETRKHTRYMLNDSEKGKKMYVKHSSGATL